MHIGIVTIATTMNYGQRLQNYAVEQILLRLGHTPETILLENSIFLNPRQKAALWGNILLKRGSYTTGYRALSFDRFNRRRMHFSKNVFPNGVFDSYDFVVCGSDQLWNLSSSFLETHKDFFFAQFIAPEKRIGFSASLGSDELSSSHRQFIAEQIDAMKAVSVRESSSARLLQPLCRREIEVTVDPVFLCSPAQWNAIAKKPRFLQKNERFILTYFLGDVIPQTRAYLQKLSAALGLRVVMLQGDKFQKNNNEEFYSMGPEEFLYLLAHSTVTLTDSFHACAFSCIFHRPFRWFPRYGGETMNCRMENIFSLFSLEDWAVGSYTEPPEHCTDCNYERYIHVIEDEKEKAIRFLQNALQTEERGTIQ